MTTLLKISPILMQPELLVLLQHFTCNNPFNPSISLITSELKTPVIALRLLDLEA